MLSRADGGVLSVEMVEASANWMWKASPHRGFETVRDDGRWTLLYSGLLQRGSSALNLDLPRTYPSAMQVGVNAGVGVFAGALGSLKPFLELRAHRVGSRLVRADGARFTSVFPVAKLGVRR